MLLMFGVETGLGPDTSAAVCVTSRIIKEELVSIVYKKLRRNQVHILNSFYLEK